MLRFQYRGNQASSVVDICMKCGSSGWKSNIISLRILIALPRCMEADQSYSFPGNLILTIVGFSPTRHLYSLYTWYPRMTPDTENERGTAVAVAVAISHYQRCLGHIANVP